MGTVPWAGAVVGGGWARLFECIDGYIRGSRGPVPSGAVVFWCGVAAVVWGGDILGGLQFSRGIWVWWEGGGGQGAMKFSYLKLFVRQFVYTVFISNNHASFHLW